jgi:16S rRNA (cytosine1402-N4)-methyltransferase
VDATAGMGGHTALIAQRLTTGLVIANDRDRGIAGMARPIPRRVGGTDPLSPGDLQRPAASVERRRISEGGRPAGGPGREPLPAHHATPGLFVFDGWAAGYADVAGYRHDGGRLVNYTAEKAIADLIYQLGEERRARKIARAIVRARPIRSTLHLADVVSRAVPRTGRLHPATKTLWPCEWRSTTNPGSWTGCSRSAPACCEGRPNGGHQFHVERRPKSERAIQGVGTRGACGDSDQASASAERRRNQPKPAVAQRQVARGGDERREVRSHGDNAAVFPKNGHSRRARRPRHPARKAHEPNRTLTSCAPCRLKTSTFVPRDRQFAAGPRSRSRIARQACWSCHRRGLCDAGVVHRGFWRPARPTRSGGLQTRSPARRSAAPGRRAAHPGTPASAAAQPRAAGQYWRRAEPRDPSASQVVHLENKGDSKVAMVKK